jgi:uncharacterized protein (DUF433 family)/DNA-binding transcriptional MerR regulator
LGRYSLPEAAGFIGMPSRTIRHWFLGRQRIFRPSYQHGKSVLLSFEDLTEAYMVHVLRKQYGYTAERIRTALEQLRKKHGQDKPLAQRDIRVVKEFMALVERKQQKGKTVDVDHAHHGNLFISEFVDALGQRIHRDKDGHAFRLYPWRNVDSTEKPVSINPNVMSGELVVSGTRIPALAILAERDAGHSINHIAALYSLSPPLVEKVILHFE